MGGGSGALVLEATSSRAATAEELAIAECESSGTVEIFNYTWQEVHDASDAGTLIVAKDIIGITYYGVISWGDNPYAIYAQSVMGNATYYALSANDYLFRVYCNAEPK